MLRKPVLYAIFTHIIPKVCNKYTRADPSCVSGQPQKHYVSNRPAPVSDSAPCVVSQDERQHADYIRHKIERGKYENHDAHNAVLALSKLNDRRG